MAAVWILSVSPSSHGGDAGASPSGSGALQTDFSTDSHRVLDWVGSWQVLEHTELFAKVDNLLDEEYVGSRRPSGVRPGKLRTASLGIRVAF